MANYGTALCPRKSTCMHYDRRSQQRAPCCTGAPAATDDLSVQLGGIPADSGMWEGRLHGLRRAIAQWRPSLRGQSSATWPRPPPSRASTYPTCFPFWRHVGCHPWAWLLLQGRACFIVRICYVTGPMQVVENQRGGAAGDEHDEGEHGRVCYTPSRKKVKRTLYNAQCKQYT